MKKQHFSLVELLVVIAIIAILAGLIIPTVGGMREKARATQAKAEMNSIKTAILSYESTYGLLPVATGTGQTILDDATPTAYDQLMEWLTQTDCTNDGNVHAGGNTRKIKFLDPPSAQGDTTYYDPWSKNADTNRRYVIVIDDNYDGRVTIGTGASAQILNGSVFIYSFGPNRNDDEGKNKANGGASGTDDINTWDK